MRPSPLCNGSEGTCRPCIDPADRVHLSAVVPEQNERADRSRVHPIGNISGATGRPVAGSPVAPSGAAGQDSCVNRGRRRRARPPDSLAKESKGEIRAIAADRRDRADIETHRRRGRDGARTRDLSAVEKSFGSIVPIASPILLVAVDKLSGLAKTLLVPVAASSCRRHPLGLNRRSGVCPRGSGGTDVPKAMTLRGTGEDRGLRADR